MNGRPPAVKGKLHEVFKVLKRFKSQYCQGEHCTMKCNLHVTVSV